MSPRILILGLVLLVFSTTAWSHEGNVHIFGVATAIDATQIVVKTREGKTLSILVDEKTKYRRIDIPASRADLRVGNRVVVEARGIKRLTATEIRFSTASRQVANLKKPAQAASGRHAKGDKRATKATAHQDHPKTAEPAKKDATTEAPGHQHAAKPQPSPAHPAAHDQASPAEKHAAHGAVATKPQPSPAHPAAHDQAGPAEKHAAHGAVATEKPADTQHQHPDPAAQMAHETPTSGAHGEHAAHESSPEAHAMTSMMTSVTGGPFRSMHAIGSGTSLLPSSSPAYMWHWMKGEWMVMAHGDVKLGLNHQGGPRGVNKVGSQNWLMLMGERQVGSRGRLMLRGMFSAEPATVPRGGFPQLFQTGETYRDRPIIDAQHPHDIFMELAAGYSVELSEQASLQFYGGPVGEPALGPVAFMHRPSAAENPAAPLSHHLQDSTHIAHGVLTAGLTAWRVRAEASLFRGAEPDENRADIEMGRLDSWSTRLWFTPTPDWAAQVSYGHLTEPEAAEPGDIDRATASIAYNRSWARGNWANALIWGRNGEEHGTFNSYLFESTLNYLDANYLYTRLELVDKAGLLEENIFGRRGLLTAGDKERPFRVGAFTFGGVRDFVSNSTFRLGIGADVTFYHVPGGLKSLYGSSPTSFQVFLRIRPGKMSHATMP